MITFFAPAARAATISASIPGTTISATSSPGSYVNSFYQFSLLIAGLLAFGVIVYGGIKYMVSSGNPSGQGDAKEWIWGALLGLLLLACAYLILNVVNPQLVNLSLPSLAPAQAPDNSGQTSVASCGQGNTYAGCTCPAGQTKIATQVANSDVNSYSCQAAQTTSNTCQKSTAGGTQGTCPDVGTIHQNCCLNVSGNAVCQATSCPVSCGAGSTDPSCICFSGQTKKSSQVNQGGGRLSTSYYCQ